MSNPDQNTVPFDTEHRVVSYQERRYKTSMQKRVHHREHRILGKILQKHSPIENKPVLDLPSGFGRLAPLLSDLGQDVIYADISNHMVNFVSSREDFRERDKAMVADVREGIDLDDQSVGSVLCIRLFQHLHDANWRQQALKEFARVSSGPMVVSFYNRMSLHYWTKTLLNFLKGKKMRVQMISKSEFKSDVKKAGLKLVECKALYPGLHAQTFAVLQGTN